MQSQRGLVIISTQGADHVTRIVEVDIVQLIAIVLDRRVDFFELWVREQRHLGVGGSDSKKRRLGTGECRDFLANSNAVSCELEG